MGIVNQSLEIPFTEKDIRTLLGLSSETSFANLFTATQINQYSYNKPLNFNGKNITDAKRLELNFGWTNLNGGGSALYEVLNAKGGGGVWQYDKPSGDIDLSPFRSKDFANYKHNSVMPLNHHLSKSSYQSNEDIYLQFDDIAELTKFAQWGICSSTDVTKLGIGIAFGTTSNKTNWSASDKWCLVVSQNTVPWSSITSNNVKVPGAFVSAYLAGTTNWYAYPFLILDTTQITSMESSTQRVTSFGINNCLMFWQSPIYFKVTTPSPRDYIKSFTISNSGYYYGDRTTSQPTGSIEQAIGHFEVVIAGAPEPFKKLTVSMKIQERVCTEPPTHSGITPLTDYEIAYETQLNLGNGTHDFEPYQDNRLYPYNDLRDPSAVRMTATLTLETQSGQTIVYDTISYEMPNRN